MGMNQVTVFQWARESLDFKIGFKLCQIIDELNVIGPIPNSFPFHSQNFLLMKPLYYSHILILVLGSLKQTEFYFTGKTIFNTLKTNFKDSIISLLFKEV